jgi:hypothetical protein
VIRDGLSAAIVLVIAATTWTVYFLVGASTWGLACLFGATILTAVCVVDAYFALRDHLREQRAEMERWLRSLRPGEGHVRLIDAPPYDQDRVL